jgi:hypothetical protein
MEEWRWDYLAIGLIIMFGLALVAQIAGWSIQPDGSLLVPIPF